MEYQNLFRPMQIGSLTYKNRIVSAPMVFGLVSLNPMMRESAQEKLAQRARGGAAAVIVGEVDVNFTDANRVPVPPCDFTNYESDEFRIISSIADTIHTNGALAIMELNHPGSEKDPYPGQKNPVGPVGFVKPNGVQVEVLDQAEMDRIVEEFAVCAKYMVHAGFDGILVHGGHGFLFTQFLSKVTNTRTDMFGGSLENRARFPIQILKAIRDAIGPDHTLDLRISVETGPDGGVTVQETGQFCHMLEGIVDSIHLSSGLYTDPVTTHQFSSMYHLHGLNADAAAVVKSYTNLPVGVIGGINSPELAERILAGGKADYIILGRQMIADPEFANKTSCGKEDQIRRCVRCYTCFPGSPEEGYETPEGMDSRQLMANVGYCAINPASGRKSFMKAEHRKRILVIGGGVAGMQAALTACERGHRVTLVEEKDHLGGVLNFTDVDVDKEDLHNLKNVVIHEVEQADIQVQLGTKANGKLIKCSGADAVIMAVGAKPLMTGIPGIETVSHALDIYSSPVTAGSVIMIGGGLVGCEAALHLAKTGHHVTIVEKMGRIASDSFGMYRDALMQEIAKCSIDVVVNAACMEVAPDYVLAEIDGVMRRITADHVYYALGMRPVDTEDLINACTDKEVYVIGDANIPAKVGDAMKAAYDVAVRI